MGAARGLLSCFACDRQRGAALSLATLSSWNETITWVMKSGDSLRSIAEDFDTTVAALEALNDFEPNAILLIGQKVLVPVGFRLPL